MDHGYFSGSTAWGEPVQLAGQVTLIIGGSRGIGRAAARTLAARGCRVAIAARGAEAVASAAAEIPGGLGVADCDVRQAAAVERTVSNVTERFGRLDILVYSAGIGRSPRVASATPQAVVSMEDAALDDVLDTNLRGLFLAIRAAARQMVPRGYGQILDISSARGARRGQAYGSAYCASKMAARAMVEAVAEELAPRGVRVMSLLPDAVDTSLIAGTTLAPRGALEPEVVGDMIAEMLTMPLDTRLDEPLLAPLGARRRKEDHNQQKG